MKKTDYDLPIFEDKDIGDLNYYSEEMAKAIKIQIDKFGNPLIFKGTVETLEELQKLTNVKNGEIYRVKIEKKNYIYDGENWTIYSDNTDSDFDELKAKTIKCLQEVETPTPVSGTSIDINDSVDAKITELKISGNSKQETRKGYNLLPNNVTTQNINGVDFTVNKNGTVLVNGTPTANAVLQLNTGITYSAGTYKLSGCPEGGATDTYRLDLMIKNNGNVPAIDVGKGAEFTITEETTFIPRIRIQSGATINNLLFEPMLVSDTSKTTYEQYGAMPSPDYQSDNESCGDNINLFDGEIESGNINSSGVNYADSTMIRSKNYTQVKPNTDIIIANNDIAIQVNVFEYDKNYNFIVKTYVNATKITTNSQTNYIKFVCSPVTKNKIKIEHNSTPTPYSPPNQGCINEVICNKNLWENKYAVTTEGITFYENSDGSKNISGTSTNQANLNNYINYRDTELSNGEIYTLSCNQQLPNGVEIRIEDYNGSNWVSNLIVLDKTTSTKTEKIILNGTRIKLLIRVQKGITVNISNLKIQLEKGSKATSYEQHKKQVYTIPTQQPFKTIGDIRDTFIKKNNKWYERHYIARKIFDGTETWAGGQISSYYRCSTTIPIKVSNDEITVISNYYKGITYNDRNSGEYNNVFGYSGNIAINQINSTSISDFKEWLTVQYNAGTPVYVDYLLETPIDIECTEEQSTILFDIEQNAKTYDKVTHMYSTDKISSYKEITYKKDIETLFANTLVEGV